MVHSYKELQASDPFGIELPQSLTTNERQLLTLFYQPLTGATPMSLYYTLWAEGENAQPEQLTHYYLMNVLDVSITTILEARIALEAIGLLRTWRKNDGDTRVFLYELVKPLAADKFLKDPLLAMFLFSKIGEQTYRKLRQRFLQPATNREGYRETTRSFTDVYQPIKQQLPERLQVTNTHASQEPYPFEGEFDFELLQAGLSEQMVPAKLLTYEVRKTIAKLAFLYDLTPLDMQKIVIHTTSVDNDKIDIKRLTKEASTYFKSTKSTTAPKLRKVIEPVQSKSLDKPLAQLTREEQLKHYLEVTSPYVHFKQINNNKAPASDIAKLLEELYVRYDMPAGVINVLIDYVMLKTDKKFPKKYVESVADHWHRKGIKTVEAAMAIARQEHDKFDEVKNPKVKPTVTQIDASIAPSAYAKTPYDFLKQLNNGKEPFPHILQMAENLVTQHGMAVDVVNVLMSYTLERSEGSLSKKFVDTIASNWQQVGIANAEAALEHIDKTLDERQKRQQAVYVPTIHTADIPQVPLDNAFAKYENMAPYDFIKAWHGGKEPFPTMVQLAENLVQVYELPIGVVNVLTEHVLTVQEGQFPKRYVEAIAGNWRTQKIQTAEAALALLSHNEVEHQAKKKKRYTAQITAQELQQILAKQPAPPEVYKRYELQTPAEFLRELNDGKEPFDNTVELAENLVLRYGLPIGVVNVLIEYIYTIKEGNLAKNYVEAVASAWRAKKFANAEEAYTYVQEEQRKYEARNAEPQSAFAKQLEKMPEWLKNTQVQNTSEQQQPQENFTVERQKLLEKLGRSEK